MANSIPPPPDEATLFGGSTPPPPPPESQVYGGSSHIPPPPSEADVFNVPAKDRVDAQGNHPNFLQAGIMDLANNPMVKDARAAFDSGSLNGFGGFVARHLYSDVLGVPKDQVNAAVVAARQDAAQRQAANAQNVNIMGHQVDPLATVSGLVGGADPTLAIPVPGLGGLAAKIAGKGLLPVAARVATRIGANAAGHAAFGSAADAAYQGADMLDGLQQNFDVQRNLHAAAVMGALGGIGGGLHEATPFVQNLFKERNGLDTLPPADPMGTTNPMSGQGGMTTEQAQAYRDVLQSGNQSDIHNFFNDKNINPPSHADINDFVQRRDGMQAGTPVDPAEGAPSHDQLASNMLGTPDLRQAVTDHIAQQTQGWKNAPEFEVINHSDDIADPAIREQAKAAGADDNTLGFVGPDNKVRVFANRIDSPETLNAVVYHESLGHFGLQQTFGDRLDSTIQTLLDRNVGKFGRDVDAWQKANPQAYGGDRIRAAEEVLANQSNSGVIKPSVQDAIVAQVRGFGRKMGLKLSYSDGEVRQIMSMAHDAVLNGTRDVRANGFKQSAAYQPMDLGSEHPAPKAVAPAEHASDGFMTPDQIKASNEIPTTAEHEAVHGPDVAPPPPPPEEQVFKDHPHIAEDGFMTPEQLAQPKAGPRYMLRTDLAADKGYVADDLERIYKALDEGYTPTTKSWAEEKRNALEMGFSPSQIGDIGDFKNLSGKLWRMQSAANMTDIKLKALNEKLGTASWTMDDQANYLTTLAQQEVLVNRIKGNRAELARALNVARAASSYSLGTMKEVAEKLREEGSGLADLAGDPLKFMKFAQQVKALMNGGNPAGAQKLIAGVNKPYWEQYINSFHFNAMLSALSTHVKAPIDMGTGILRDVLEKAVAMPIGAVRKAIWGGETGVTPGEMMAHTYGSVKALMSSEVYKQMAKATVTGEGGFVGPDGKFQPVNMMNQYGSVSNPDLGPILSLPSHLVSAQDLFFRSQGMQTNMYSYAMREAQKALPGASLDQQMTHASSLAMTPTQAMLDYAKDRTDRSLLLNNNPLNNFLTKMRTYGPNMTVGQRVAAFTVNTLAPFIRVESNSLINRVVQRSPLAFLDPYTIKVLKAGGPEADIALAKVAYGTLTLGMAWAAADKLTGDLSANPNKKKELEAGNEMVNAVHEKGKYDQSSNLAMSLFPWDQHNATAQIVKSAKDAFEAPGATPGQKMVGLKMAMTTVMHSLADMSWMSSTTPFTDALTSHDQAPQKIAGLVGDQAKTFVPMILNQAERMTDSKRDAKPDDPTDISGTVMNNIKSAIPGLASTLPAHYSVYGRPMETGATPEGVHNWFGEGNHLAETSDPTEKELNRLANLTKAAIVTPTSHTIKGHGWPSSIKLTTAQAEEYQMYAGQAITGAVKDQMDSGQWAQLSDAEKVAQVRAIQKQAKSQVRDALIDKPGWFNGGQLQKLKDSMNGQ